jgi:hypothetical protein
MKNLGSEPAVSSYVFFFFSSSKEGCNRSLARGMVMALQARLLQVAETSCLLSELFLSPCTKLKSKWIKDLHIIPETLKSIEEKVGKSLEDMGTGERIPKQNHNGLCCKIKN